MFVINFLNSYFMCTIGSLQTADGRRQTAVLRPCPQPPALLLGRGKLLLLFQTHLPTLLLLLLLLFLYPNDF